MKLSWPAALCCSIIGAWLLSGCAGTATRPAWEVGNRPQMLMPGGMRDDVRGIAMGSARSKGWTIVDYTDDRLVMQRPLDPASPTAAVLGIAPGSAPAVIEVNALFVERADGVNVALGADLISHSPGEQTAKRTDITESFRAELTQSLESLRSTWSTNRQRVAQAIPPIMTPAERTAQGATEDTGGDAGGDAAIQAWGEAVRQSESPSPAVADTGPAPAPVSAPLPPPNQAPPPSQNVSAVPAPVVEGSRTMTRSPAPTRPVQPSILPPVPPEPAGVSNDMLVLSQASGAGTWAYYAEQYARLRGCNITDQGAILVETRSDGEIHKVPCLGSDSFLLKCSDGVCRGLR